MKEIQEAIKSAKNRLKEILDLLDKVKEQEAGKLSIADEQGRLSLKK